MAESTHRAEVVPVILEAHPNADSLSIVKVYDGYQVVVRTEDWVGKDRGVYIQPDSIVPNTPEFSFLDGKFRIKAKKLRGIWSMGMLYPAPDNAPFGEDFAPALGIMHYEPPVDNLSTGGECEKPPTGLYPTYDVESFRKYARKTFEPLEVVWVTEKLHGSSARFLFDGEQFHCGSHSQWKRNIPGNLWWRILQETPHLEHYLQSHPGTAVYGEIYGQVQNLKYSVPKHQVRFAAFDILENGKWMDSDKAIKLSEEYGFPWVPLIARTQFHFETILNMADGKSLIPGADHFREGIVVKSAVERYDPRCFRAALKIVSNEYLAWKHS